MRISPRPQGRDEALIRMHGVSKDYTTAGGSFRALKDIDLEIYPGEFVAIVGKSGAGKTTLINMLSRRRPPDSAARCGSTGCPSTRWTRTAWRCGAGASWALSTSPFTSCHPCRCCTMCCCRWISAGCTRGEHSAGRGLDLLHQVELKDHAHKLPGAISGRAAAARGHRPRAGQ